MFRLTLVLRFTTLLTVASALILVLGGPAQAISIVINNGLAPPNSANVINDATYSGDYAVYVRNVGCPPAWPSGGADWPCPSPGAPTEVALVENGAVGGTMKIYESSTLTMSGGAIGISLEAWDDSTITMTGGTVLNSLGARGSSIATMSDGYVGANLYVENSSIFTMTGGFVDNELEVTSFASFTMSGGTIGGALRAGQSSTITIVGYDFEVNNNPVPYGDLSAVFGSLTGTLASGESLDNVFYQGGGSYTGTIRLVPEPSTGLLLGFGLMALAAGRRRR